MRHGVTVDPIYGPMLDLPPWAISSGVERFLHTEEATGSIPVSPTMTLPLLDPSLAYKTACVLLPEPLPILDRILEVGYTSL